MTGRWVFCAALALWAGAAGAQPSPRSAPALTAVTLDDGLAVWMAPRTGSPDAYATVVCTRAGDEDARVPIGVATLSGSAMQRFVRERCDVPAVGSIDHGEMRMQWHGTDLTVACGVRAMAVMAQTAALRDDWFATWRDEVASQWERTVLRERIDDDALMWTFGEGHPLVRRMFPAAGEVQSLPSAWVRWFLRSRYDPGRCALAVVGGFDPATLTPALRRAVGGWSPLRLEARPTLQTQTPPHPIRTLVYDVPTQELADLRLLLPLPPRAGHEAVDRVIETILGWGPHSRLNRIVREARGVSYGLRARRRRERDQQWIELSGAVLIGSVGDTLVALAGELDRLRRSGPTEREVLDARARQRALSRMAWDDDEDLSALLAAELAAGRAPPRLDDTLRALDAVTADDVRRRIADAPPWHDVTVAVYGPAATIVPSLTSDLVHPVTVR